MSVLDPGSSPQVRYERKPVSERILVVDDDNGVRDVVCRLLRDRYDVAAASSGEEALPLLRHQCWNLLILDVGLPGISGLEILQAARRAHLDFPVLMLTACTDLDVVKTALNGGVHAYVTKPFECGQLEVTVQLLLASGQSGSGDGRPWRVNP